MTIDFSMCGMLMCLLKAIFCFYIEIQCMPYEPQGICKGFLSQFDHPVKIAINTSLGIGTIEQTADLFYTILTSRLPVHKQCLDVLLPYICRWIFSTCDPAYNESIEQYTCRRTCEIFTNFVCNEVWLIVISQLENLNFLGANVPVCDGLERANGGDVPDCIDALQGGKYMSGWSLMHLHACTFNKL